MKVGADRDGTLDLAPAVSIHGEDGLLLTVKIDAHRVQVFLGVEETGELAQLFCREIEQLQAAREGAKAH